MKDYLYTCVAGYGWSGSGAVVDLLKEFHGLWAPPKEFELIKAPHGIMDLEYRLTERGGTVNSDVAIKEFLLLVQHLYRTPTAFSKAGLGYGEIFGDNFIRLSHEFVQRITRYRYQSHWWYLDFMKSFSAYALREAFVNMKWASRNENLFFTDITEERFRYEVGRYLNALFLGACGKDKVQGVILDQSIPVRYPEKMFDYFSRAKMIIVDRDPRDIYVDLIESNVLLGIDLAKTHDARKYVRWHKAKRTNDPCEHKNLLRLRFEDIVLNYEDTVQKVIAFIGDGGIEMKHLKKNRYFKPQRSKGNIGKYKKFPYQNEIKLLEKKLPMYLYDRI